MLRSSKNAAVFAVLVVTLAARYALMTEWAALRGLLHSVVAIVGGGN